MDEGACNEPDDTPEARRKKLMKYVRELELTREERMDLASYLLRRDVTTWRTLTDGQRWRLLDAIEGYDLIREILRQRP